MKTLLITLLLCAGIGWGETVDAGPRSLAAYTDNSTTTCASTNLASAFPAATWTKYSIDVVNTAGTTVVHCRSNGTNWITASSTGGSGDTITSPNTTINVGGTTTNTTLDVNTAIIESLAQGQTMSPNSGYGSVAAGTLTVTLLPSPGAFVDSNGYALRLRISSSNAITTGTTITVAGLGAKTILRPDGVTAFSTGDMITNVPFDVNYVPTAAGGGGAWVLTSLPSACATCVVNNGVNTFTAAGTLDMHAATTANATIVQALSGCTAGADGAICYDPQTGQKVTHIRTNGADSIAAATTATTTSTALVLHGTAVAGVYAPSAIIAADLPYTASVFNSGTITVPAGTSVLVGCTSTCAVPVPVPAAGYQICVKNDAGVATVITMNALGSSAMYPKSDDSGYGTAGTGTMVSTAAAGNKVCLIGRDATHYELGAINASANWTVN